jgi:hypothetical protein
MGELATASHVLGIAHNTGYPLYILLAKLFTLIPIGDVAHRVNLMSAVFAALTVATVYLIVHRLTGSWLASALGSLTVAFSSTLWASANWAESYPLNAFSTSEWEQGEIIKEEYYVLIPRGLDAGLYRVRMRVYEGPQAGPAGPSDAGSGDVQIIGTVTVK